jgi:hypothetical protein
MSIKALWHKVVQSIYKLYSWAVKFPKTSYLLCVSIKRVNIMIGKTQITTNNNNNNDKLVFYCLEQNFWQIKST